MKYWMLAAGMSVALGSGLWGATPAEAAGQWAKQGRALFLSCDFKQAAHSFEKAAAEDPERADVHYWLGRSYSRLADVSGPLTAPKYAHKAARSLELAVRMEPGNEEYVHELLDLYVDSPEWFGGGLTRARALVEEVPMPSWMAEAAMQHINASRDEHSGAPWRMRQAILRTTGTVGTLVPVR